MRESGMQKQVKILMLLAGLFFAACSRKPPPAAVQAGPKLAGLPVEIKVKQRTTTPVPSSDGAVQLTVDDITSGQVMVSLAGKDGSSLLSQTSLEKGKAAAFKFGGGDYVLSITDLNNALLGEDFVTLTISEAQLVLSESAKIERLIGHVQSMEGATFIRNGSDYSPVDATAHLRRKWKAADADGSMTAATFVDKIASKSSLSDELYRIRLRDGTEVNAGEYLHKQLESLK